MKSKFPGFQCSCGLNFKKSWFALLTVIAFSFCESSPAQPPPQNVQGAWIWYGWYGAESFARLTWDESPGATNYSVYLLDTNANTWNAVASGVTAGVFFDSYQGPLPATYAVSAVGPDGESAAISAIVPGDDGSYWPWGLTLNPPMEPTTLGPSSACIWWCAPPVSGADGMVELGTTPTNLTITAFNTNYQGCHQIWVSNLSPATVYYCRITSVGTNRLGEAALFSFLTSSTNELPVAADVVAGQVWDYATYLTLSCTDDEPFSLPYTFRVVSVPTNGSLSALTLTAYGAETHATVAYMPNPGARGEDHFQYVANDGELDSAPATVTITNIFLNRAPVASSWSTNTAEDVPLSLALEAADPDGDALTCEVTFVEYGTVEGPATNLVYTPPANFFGEDTIIFTARDEFDAVTSGTITIAVDSVNDVPVIGPPDLPPVYEDVPSYVGVEATDVEGAPLTFRVVVGPTNGTLSGDAPYFMYTAHENYNGSDSYTVVANDGNSDSAPLVVSFIVEPVNDAPVALSQSLAIAEDLSTNIVLNASDVEGDTLSYQIWGPYHGTLTGSAPNLIYTPDLNYNGEDSFTFIVFDGTEESLTAGEVMITIIAVNDPPVAAPQSLTTPYNTALPITLSGTDVDSTNLSFTVVSQPAKGSLSGTPPNLTFVPNTGATGATSFSFRAGDGGAQSEPATVTVTIQSPTAVPAAPSGLTAAAASRTQINLAWTDNSANEDGFKIEQSLNGSSWTQVATVGPNVRSYSRSGLASNKLYYFRVRAYNVLGNSAYSNRASAKTLK